MATLSLQRFCLLLLLSSEVLALDCSKTAEYQLQVNNPEIQKLMEAIGGRQQLPQGCLYKRPTFSFPGAKILQAGKEGKRVAMKVILERTLGVFEHNITQAGWDARTIELLKNTLYQQSNQWKNCSATEPGEVVSRKVQDLNLILRRYFRQMQAFLEGQQYDLCAWSLVRLEIWRLFFINLDQLLNRF